MAQEPATQSSTPISETFETIEQPDLQPIRISGIVAEQKKYSFVVRSQDREYEIKLATDADVALTMNKPWFDWDNDRVIVDSAPHESATEKTTERVPFDLPGKPLYLISRFKDAEQMKRIMSVKTKRLNFYLITPVDQGSHLPSEKQPYLAGELAVEKSDGPVALKVDQQSESIKLGFRNATMSGFSIADLKPETTSVTLAGMMDQNTNIVSAVRVIFRPVHKAPTKAAIHAVK